VAQAAQIAVAAVLVVAMLYTTACARKALREARAVREDIQRLLGALEFVALLVVERSGASSTATPVDVEAVEPSHKGQEHENP
jgi:hypothetical protein